MPSPVVLITGCSGKGIGFSTAVAFHAAGCRVFASARNLERLKASNLPDNVQLVQMDVCRPESVQAAVDEIIAKAGQIGRGCIGALVEVDMGQVRDSFETNVFGLLNVCQVVSKSMINRRRGLIVNISSIVSFVPTPWAGTYCATKASVTSLTDVLRMELKGFGIGVMCVFPGAIKSDIGAANAANSTVKDSGPYANVRAHIEGRGSWSQCAKSTPASQLAEEIVQNALKPSPPAYLSSGYRSARAWWSYYLPVAWKDYFWGTGFGTRSVGQKEAYKS